MVTLGQFLKKLRGDTHSVDVCVKAKLSVSHLLNIEADKSRPSAEVLKNLLYVYDPFEEDKREAWAMWVREGLPVEARRHVKVVPTEVRRSRDDLPENQP
jgi:transcriptional regulator with XRE-family HTH domain